MIALLLALALTSAMQGTNACDGATPRIYPLCIGEPLTLWLCTPPATGPQANYGYPTNGTPLPYAATVDGAPQPSGFLVRYGYNGWGQHLDAPGDVSLTGKVQYITSRQVLVATPGPHTVTVTYGAGQTATIPLLGVTSVTSLTELGPDGKPVVSACAAAARR